MFLKSKSPEKLLEFLNAYRLRQGIPNRFRKPVRIRV